MCVRHDRVLSWAEFCMNIFNLYFQRDIFFRAVVRITNVVRGVYSL